MPVKKRALLIGMMGPTIQGAGFLWQAAHFYLFHLHDGFTVRHLVFEPGFMMVLVGFLVSLVCVPLATEVAGAQESELDIPILGTGDEAMPGQRQLPGLGGVRGQNH